MRFVWLLAPCGRFDGVDVAAVGLDAEPDVAHHFRYDAHHFGEGGVGGECQGVAVGFKAVGAIDECVGVFSGQTGEDFVGGETAHHRLAALPCGDVGNVGPGSGRGAGPAVVDKLPARGEDFGV